MHGAHAKSTLLCHIQNLILFVGLPWLIAYYHINTGIMYSVSGIALLLIIIYAPAATKKQPIPERLKPRKNKVYYFSSGFNHYFYYNTRAI